MPPRRKLTAARPQARRHRCAGNPLRQYSSARQAFRWGGAGRSWLRAKGIKARALAASRPLVTGEPAATGRLRQAVEKCAYFVRNLTAGGTRVHALAPAIETDADENF